MECVWPLKAILGEGPVWVEREQALWLVDIKAPRLLRFHPASGERSSFAAPAQCGFLLPCADGGFIAGLQDGLHRFDPASGRFDLLAPVEPDKPGNRLNDGVVDPSGHLWFGTMDDEEAAHSGRFYRLDDDGVARPRGFGCAITNGPAFSPDGRTGYFVDTLARRIWACDVDAHGALSGQRLFAEIAETDGYPDGPCVDSAGDVWIGLYGGWAARRYAPDGTLAESVAFPVANITKLAFGGADLACIYATTAAKGLSEADLAGQPLAGALLSFPARVPGAPGVEIRYGL